MVRWRCGPSAPQPRPAMPPYRCARHEINHQSQSNAVSGVLVHHIRIHSLPAVPEMPGAPLGPRLGVMVVDFMASAPIWGHGRPGLRRTWATPPTHHAISLIRRRPSNPYIQRKLYAPSIECRAPQGGMGYRVAKHLG